MLLRSSERLAHGQTAALCHWVEARPAGDCAVGRALAAMPFAPLSPALAQPSTLVKPPKVQASRIKPKAPKAKLHIKLKVAGN